MGIFGLFTTNLFAQQDATIDPADIRYWVGEGDNEVVVAISWCSYTETALAWGYRFNGDATVFQALTAIAEADSRLTVVGAAPTNITYVDDNYNLTMCPNPSAGYGDPDYDIPMHSVNGAMGQNMMSAEPIHNNDFVKIGGYACGVMSSDWTTITWSTEIIPATDPNAGEEAVDATIDPADIRFWIGEGENEVVFIVNWNEPDTALAWGYRFNAESITVKAMMDEIAAEDYRFDFVGESFISDITFEDGYLNLQLSTGGYFMYNVDGVMAQYGVEQQLVGNGSYVKFGDTNCGTDPEGTWNYVWTKEVAAVYPLAEEARIDFSEIVYWVGEGQNEVVFAVNWAEPDKCLAWGYRFSEAEVTVEVVMDAIAAADERFAYVGSDGWLSDFTYNDGSLNLALAGPYFMYNINGIGAWYGYNEQTVVNGDFIKWGDVSCGIEIAPWTYVWTQTVEPVSMPTGLNENQSGTVSVYPNPAVSETYVTLENDGMNKVSVYDAQGRLVSTTSYTALAGEKVRISTESLTAGVYFVRVSNDNSVKTAKLIVK